MVLEKTPESPLDCKEIQPVILREINLEYSLEGLILMLNLQYFCCLIRRASSLERTLMLRKIAKGERGAEDEMIRQHHRLNGHESEQTVGSSGGQRSLHSSTGSAVHRITESDTT